MSLLALTDISRVFKSGDEEVRALWKLNLVVEPAEYLAIQGTSGSGKSTLLYILGLLDKPSSGQYLFRSTSVAELSETQAADLRNEAIGFVFQSFHLLARSSALSNVMMPLFYRRSGPALSRNAIREKAGYYLQKVGLENRMHHLPNELSGGQKQRVAIARALVTEPALLLADEPTGNLDSNTSHDVMNLFEQIQASGVTVVVITHDEKVASRAARQVRLEDGRVAEDSHYAII
jgi:putative ABC transport system ATP-binding protein